MAMPKLDPSRHVEAVLADPTHKLPLPDRNGRLFLAEGEVVDRQDAFYAQLFADGSLVVKPAAPAAKVEAKADESVAVDAKTDEPVAEAPAPKVASKADMGVFDAPKAPAVKA